MRPASPSIPRRSWEVESEGHSSLERTLATVIPPTNPYYFCTKSWELVWRDYLGTCSSDSRPPSTSILFYISCSSASDFWTWGIRILSPIERRSRNLPSTSFADEFYHVCSGFLGAHYFSWSVTSTVYDAFDQRIDPVYPNPMSVIHRWNKLSDEVGKDSNYNSDRLIFGGSVVIGISSTILESVIWKNVTIGRDVTILRSVIGDGIIIVNRSDLLHALTADDCHM